MSVSLYGFHLEGGVLTNSYGFDLLKSGESAVLSDAWVPNPKYVPELDINFSGDNTGGNFYYVFSDVLGYELAPRYTLQGDIQQLQDKSTLRLLNTGVAGDVYTFKKMRDIIAFCIKAKEYGATHFYAV